MKVSVFFKPVDPWYGLNLNGLHSLMSPATLQALGASCSTEGNNSKLDLYGVVFELILTYSLQLECHLNDYLAKQSFELTEFSKWLPHLAWTAVTNCFHSAGFKI